MWHLRGENRVSPRGHSILKRLGRREITNKNWGNDHWESKLRLSFPGNQVKKVFQRRSGHRRDQIRGGLTWSYQSRALSVRFWWSATLSIVVLGEWWRSLIGKDLRVEGRGSEDRKYRQFFQGVLPQKKAKIWSKWPGTESRSKSFCFLKSICIYLFVFTES